MFARSPTEEATFQQVKAAVKAFILEEFLFGENSDELTDEVELMMLGILDSVSLLKTVDFVEKRFNIRIHPAETDRHHFNTLPLIAATICAKL